MPFESVFPADIFVIDQQKASQNRKPAITEAWNPRRNRPAKPRHRRPLPPPSQTGAHPHLSCPSP